MTDQTTQAHRNHLRVQTYLRFTHTFVQPSEAPVEEPTQNMPLLKDTGATVRYLENQVVVGFSFVAGVVLLQSCCGATCIMC